MSLIMKKDVGVLLSAGFSEEDLGLVEGGFQGVEIYSTPEDYFARELIQNACEQGECSIWDDIIPPDDRIGNEPYDTSRKSIYADNEYPGNDDGLDGVPRELWEQLEWIKGIKLGKMAIWQRKGKKGYEWQVKNLHVLIPDHEKARYSRMSRDRQKDLWISYAKDEWKHIWECAAMSLRTQLIEESFSFTTKEGHSINAIAISVDGVKNEGCTSLPPEARWITMIYFNKDNE